MDVSSRSLRHPPLASCFSSEAFGTLGTTRLTRNSRGLYVGRLCNSSYGRNARNAAGPILVTSIPILYKNQPSRHTAMGTDVNPRHPISKCASDPSSTWSPMNDSSSMSGFTNQWDELSFPSRFGKNSIPGHAKKPNFRQSYSTGAGANYNPDLSEDFSKVKGFDICLPRSKGLSRRTRKINYETIQKMYPCASYRVLRPGMVLSKNFYSLSMQVDIVRTCRKLGAGPGGFYRPVYKDGAKPDLWMMSLGLNWNPEKLTYEFIRSVDGCEVPPIPSTFIKHAHDAVYYAEQFLETEFDVATYEGIIPSCAFNTCVVSFCSATTGGLGLHQDCSERRENLSKGLPVVSISVGDSAEFLYGDERDVNKAKKVLLESGDMLIFGGKSRHIYHGVRSIIPNSASEFVLEDTRLRPGRLNLTFREA